MWYIVFENKTIQNNLLWFSFSQTDISDSITFIELLIVCVLLRERKKANNQKKSTKRKRGREDPIKQSKAKKLIG